MRAIAISILAFVVGACGSSKSGGDEQAKQQAQELEKAKGSPKPAEKIHAPVTNEAHIPCEQLIIASAFQTALGEKDPLTVLDVTKKDAEAAASCSLLKGGKKLTIAQQNALSKKHGQRLGVIPGDALCNITAYCWTVESDESNKKHCADLKSKGGPFGDDESMGNYACVQTVIQGEDDALVYRFFDADSKCILSVRGGPSMTDKDKVLACAKTARDSITATEIDVQGTAPLP